MLRRFAQPPSVAGQCELCSAELAAEHEHLVEVSTRQLLCACQACAILFGYEADIKYRRVPRRVRALCEFQLSDAVWNSLGIPIGLAFFFDSTPAQRIVAIYPSPAGPTESLLELDAWEDLARENPVLSDLEPDVEALLVNRVARTPDAPEHTAADSKLNQVDTALPRMSDSEPRNVYYLAPIDQCYKLVGLIRRHWKGLSGGREVWDHIEQFFSSLKERSR